MIYYGYEEFSKDAKNLARLVKDSYAPDAFVPVVRGGLTLGHFITVALGSRNLFPINSIHYNDTQKLDTIDVFNIPNLNGYKRILLIDDIIDSGESMVEILRVLKEKFPHAQFKVATLFYKKHALLKPDFSVKEANDWIEFFWEKVEI